MSDSGKKLEKIIKDSFVPFLEKVQENGIKLSIEKILPGFVVNDFIIEKTKRSLKFEKKLNLGKLGYANIYYRDSIIIEPVGIVKLIVKNFEITNEKIIAVFDNILEQIEQNFLQNKDYILLKFNKVLTNLTEIGFYTCSTSEEKTIYDFLLVIIFKHYRYTNSEFPDWFKDAIKNVGRKAFAQDCLNFFAENLFQAIKKIIDSVYFDYEMIFDSLILRFFLNKKTNYGQISKILHFFNIDLFENLENFIKNYTGESFLNGFGEMLFAMVDALVCEVSIEKTHKSNNNFNFTSTFGKDAFSRRFRWFGNNNNTEFLEISKSEDFEKCEIIKANHESVVLARPTVLNLGAVTKYKIENKFLYSAEIKDLHQDTEYYIRIKRPRKNYINKFKTCEKNENFEFLVFADSQGMIKEDYEVFKKTLETSIKIFSKNSPPEFLIHLGDFVDDGNNENYWDFILESKIWGSFSVLPVVGNHETKFNPPLKFQGIQNSISTHFNLEKNKILDENLNGIYYYFEHKNALFVVLDTNLPDGLGKRQINWARRVFENSKVEWKIILTHKTAYSYGPHYADYDVRCISEEIAELAAIGNVCLVLGGHDHVYSRSKHICLNKYTNEEKHSENFINPDGTIFVTMGTSGVKNYKISRKNSNDEVVLDLKVPLFAKIEIKTNELCVKIYEINNSKIIDQFIICKNKNIKFNHELISRKIENLPDCPCLTFDRKINEVTDLYNRLEEKEKKKVNNLKKLRRIYKSNKTFNKILNSDIAIVESRNEFLDAINNSNFRTIIINFNEIKFENKFGFGRKIKVNRDLLIKGNAKLTFVSFIVGKNISLILGGSIRIDNNRKIFSLLPTIHAFEMYKNSILVLSDNAYIEQAFGIGKSSTIKAIGKNIRVYMKSNNFKKIPENFTIGSSIDII
ncbi:MAG: metallophosphoesterase [Oscillospiraceae bacterium]|nr:metallophosphoesterase [Oscillospiraceae bacterium]